MPAKRKPTQQRDPERKKAALEVVPDVTGVEAVVPPAPAKWSNATKVEWAEFWTSELATAVQVTDRPAIQRLFTMRSMQAKAMARWERKPYVEGSQGQPVQNPAFAESMTLERQILALERSFGLTLKAKADLGIAMGQARLTAAELNRMAEEDTDDSDDDGVIDVDGWEEAQ